VLSSVGMISGTTSALSLMGPPETAEPGNRAAPIFHITSLQQAISCCLGPLSLPAVPGRRQAFGADRRSPSVCRDLTAMLLGGGWHLEMQHIFYPGCRFAALLQKLCGNRAVMLGFP
jgi:hypothetical protein